MSHELDAKASGCNITKQDTQSVIGSITCSAAYGVYGACFSSLGAALPELADKLDKSTSDFGIAFTTRGVGYLIGTLLSAYLIGNPKILVSKPLIACLFLAITGVAMFMIAESTSFMVVMILFSVQGIGFGGIDMMCNCAVPELWGSRAGPWMQAMHTCFGFGAVFGPTIVGSMGYKTSFTAFALLSILPIMMCFSGYFCESKQPKSMLTLSLPNVVSRSTIVTTPQIMNRTDRKSFKLSNSTLGSAQSIAAIYNILEAGQLSPRKKTVKRPNTDMMSQSGDGQSPRSRYSSPVHSPTRIISSPNKYSNNSPRQECEASRHRVSIAEENHNSTVNVLHSPLNDSLCRQSFFHSITDDNELTTSQCYDVNNIESTLHKERPLPILIKYLITLFYCIFIGYVSGVSGWISTYALDIGVTESTSKAAYLISLYWISITIGRIIAIFVAIYFTATRIELNYSCLLLYRLL